MTFLIIKIYRTILFEFLLAGMIVIALTLLLNPFNILTTSAFVLTLIMLLAITFISCAVFVWREQPRDEREALPSLYAGRMSYFAGGEYDQTEQAIHKLLKENGVPGI